ncbi:MAG: hypothetical protein AUG83_08090 [Acidobacteria bacterium 13_1_20CM_4_57_11]|nr:MAG: hypothetical protein AUG83_08090 [Acidobacteria bacterium 13_1_20CM_4_57_11]
MRERVSILPTSTYLSKMHDAGWTLIALEWEREVESSSAPEPEQLPAASEEIPFGLRIGSDCRHLEDDPLEMQTLASFPAPNGNRVKSSSPASPGTLSFPSAHRVAAELSWPRRISRYFSCPQSLTGA